MCVQRGWPADAVRLFPQHTYMDFPPMTEVDLYWALWASTATNIKCAHNTSFDIIDALSRIWWTICMSVWDLVGGLIACFVPPGIPPHCFRGGCRWNHGWALECDVLDVNHLTFKGNTRYELGFSAFSNTLRSILQGHPGLDGAQCTRLSTLSIEVLMTDLAFIGRLLKHGAPNLDSIIWGIICNDCNYDLHPDIEVWREWFKHASPLQSMIIRFSLTFNHHAVKSWLWALNEAVEISEYILHSHLLENGITILGVVEPLRLPLEFGSLSF